MPRTDDAAGVDAPSAARRISGVRVFGVLACAAVIVYAIDQVAKFLVSTHLDVGETVPVLGQLVQLHYVSNSGAAFSIGTGTTWVFAILAAAVAVFIVVFSRRIRSFGWAVLFGMLLGGNLGNLTDRLLREPGFGVGHVVDFFQIAFFPAIFNVADMAIVASMALFIVLTVRGIRLDGSRISRQPDPDPESNGDADAVPESTTKPPVAPITATDSDR